MKKSKRKAALCLLLPLFLLAACAAPAAEEDDGLDALRRRYAGDCAAEVRVAVLREEETARYALSVEREGETARVTVAEPETLAGVTAELTGEALTLRYDGMALDAGSISPRLSAVNCVPLLLRALETGSVRARNEEDFNGEPALRLCLETEQDGETLLCTVFLSQEDLPLYGEWEENGKIIVSMEFTSFDFRDIMEPRS